MAFKQRPVAPQAALGWRLLFPAALVGLGFATMFLAREGADLVLDTNAGEYIEAIRDPAGAGYEAFVKPTETLLLTVTNDDLQLVGVALLSPATDSGGGTIVVVPPGLTIDNAAAPFGFDLMTEVHKAGGADAVTAALQDIFNIGFAAEIELDAEAFRKFVEPYTPLSFDLSYTLEERQDGSVITLLPTQTGLQLDADGVMLVFSHRNDDEEGVNRLDRQRDLYAELLAAGRATSPTPNDTDDIAAVRTVLEHLGSAGVTRVIVENLEVTQRAIALEDTSINVLRPNLEAIPEQLLHAVPLPEAAELGSRPAIKLTNGVGDIEQNPPIIQRIVRAGGVLSIIANTDIADVEISQLKYRVPGQAAAAETMADELGIARILEDPTLSELVDYELVLGRDLVVS